MKKQYIQRQSNMHKLVSLYIKFGAYAPYGGFISKFDIAKYFYNPDIEKAHHKLVKAGKLEVHKVKEKVDFDPYDMRTGERRVVRKYRLTREFYHFVLDQNLPPIADYDLVTHNHNFNLPQLDYPGLVGAWPTPDSKKYKMLQAMLDYGITESAGAWATEEEITGIVDVSLGYVTKMRRSGFLNGEKAGKWRYQLSQEAEKWLVDMKTKGKYSPKGFLQEPEEKFTATLKRPASAKNGLLNSSTNESKQVEDQSLAPTNGVMSTTDIEIEIQELEHRLLFLKERNERMARNKELEKKKLELLAQVKQEEEKYNSFKASLEQDKQNQFKFLTIIPKSQQ